MPSLDREEFSLGQVKLLAIGLFVSARRGEKDLRETLVHKRGAKGAPEKMFWLLRGDQHAGILFPGREKKVLCLGVKLVVQEVSARLVERDDNAPPHP